MSKINDNNLVPKLRFPDFAKDKEWILNQLGNVYSFITTNSFSRDDLNYNNGEVKNIHYGDIHTKFSTLFDITKEIVPFINESIPLDKFKQENYCKEKDMIFADASEDLKDVGKSIELVNLNNEKLLSGLHTIHARQINDEIAVGFGGYLFLNENIRKQIQRESQGAKVLGISATRLSNINIFYPQKKTEQQKIASCLSSLDGIITAESQKLEVLKDHKKGLLQNLFPQKSKTIPKFRFKEFVGEWKNVSLGSLIEIKGRIGYRGYTTNDIVEKGKGAITFSPSNIDDNNQLNFDKATYISWEKYYESPEIMLQDGFTVLVKTGSSFGKAVFIKDLPEKTTINPQLVVLKPKNINPMFLFLLFCNSAIQNQIKEAVVGGAIPTLSQESISNFEILIPPDKNKKEQEKIANTLSSIDDFINAQIQKIEALNLHKNGLLQGLFPSINNE